MIKIKSTHNELHIGTFVYSPEVDTIYLSYEIRYAHAWKRQAIALFMHELIHAFQWHIIYKKDSDRWNDNGEVIESQANKTQNFILKLLLVSV